MVFLLYFLVCFPISLASRKRVPIPPHRMTTGTSEFSTGFLLIGRLLPWSACSSLPLRSA